MTKIDSPKILGTSLFSDVLQILQVARQKAYSAVNFAMVEAYWNIGKRIVQEEQHGEKRVAYGEGVIKELGKGFSIANLENFRKFYLAFRD